MGNAFDNDGSGALNFSEFKEAWRFLQKPGDDRRIKSAFDNQDVDGSGHVDQNEFAFALMGSEALKYGPLADMELLNGMLDQVSGNMMAQLAAEGAMKKSAAQQASENDALRKRLETLKAQQDSDMAKMIGKINALAGMDAIKFMSEEEMDKILYDVFKKFDVDGSGTMELPEFKVAWRKELNLGGTDAEIAKAFKDVDVDNSGVIEITEFKDAIKGERMAELNMKVIASNMESSIDSLADYMQNFKKRYDQAMATFDAFDKDGNGELQFPEYTSAWRFLSQPGSDRDIKQAFDGVDVDRSGLVDRGEFVFSIMGPDAANFGPIADMDRLDALMDGLFKLIDNHSGELASLSKT